MDSMGFFWPGLVRFYTAGTAPLAPLPGAFFWGAGSYFGGGNVKKYVSEKVGTVGELCEGKIIKKWGGTSLLIQFYPES